MWPHHNISVCNWRVEFGPAWLTQLNTHSGVHLCVICQLSKNIDCLCCCWRQLYPVLPDGTTVYCHIQGCLVYLHNLSGLWRRWSLTPETAINKRLKTPPGVSTPSVITLALLSMEKKNPNIFCNCNMHKTKKNHFPLSGKFSWHCFGPSPRTRD